VAADSEFFRRSGVDVCYELHPVKICTMRDLRALSWRGGWHKRANILYDPAHDFAANGLSRVSGHYHERVRAFHVKDAEYGTGSGVYGATRWIDGRASVARRRQIDFHSIFSKMGSTTTGLGRVGVDAA